MTHPELSPSGQRLYSADDVRRLALIKQLTDLGHAIGSLALLDMPPLQRVASTHVNALAATQTDAHSMEACSSPGRAWRLAVTGAALGSRLRRPALLRRLDRPVELLGPFDDAAQAAATLGESGVDALLIHQPHLHENWLASIDAAAPAIAGVPKAVLYIFGKNKGEKKFAMTAPVTQTAMPLRMDMTAPVTQAAVAGGMRVQFVLPKGVSLATAPEPIEPRVHLREEPGGTWAVIRYSGNWLQSNYLVHLGELKTSLEAAGVTTQGEPVLARHNAPFTPWFMRRNEIWLALR